MEEEGNMVVALAVRDSDGEQLVLFGVCDRMRAALAEGHIVEFEGRVHGIRTRFALVPGATADEILARIKSQDPRSTN